MPVLTVLPDNKTVEVPLNAKLMEVCEELGLGPTFGCGQAACGSCRIQIVENPQHVNRMTKDEMSFLGVEADFPCERLACQLRIEGDIIIRI